jgi:hypothetical protein
MATQSGLTRYHNGCAARTVYFITHPDVLIDPAVPVPEWPLSRRGQQRMSRALMLAWVGGVGAIWCSTELLRYARCYLAGIVKVAACNAVHSIRSGPAGNYCLSWIKPNRGRWRSHRRNWDVHWG